MPRTHPQTILAFKLADEILPARHGFPMKVRVPAKLGFKKPKHITALFVTNRFPAGSGKIAAATGSGAYDARH